MSETNAKLKAINGKQDELREAFSELTYEYALTGNKKTLNKLKKLDRNFAKRGNLSIVSDRS